MDRDKDRTVDGRPVPKWRSDSSRAVAFDYANDLAAHTRSSWDRSRPDSNTPNTDWLVDRTNRNSIEAAAEGTWAAESLEGLRNDGETNDH